MALTGSYKAFLRALEKWPVDTSKKGRDVGEYIRHRIKLSYGGSQVTEPIAEDGCVKAAASLQRLADNQYGKAFKRVSQSSATGLTAEQCTGVLSSDFMESVQEENQSFTTKLFGNKN